jgi:hypothetical protein
MVTIDSGRPAVTWDELVRTRPDVAEDWESMKRYREQAGIRIH